MKEKVAAAKIYLLPTTDENLKQLDMLEIIKDLDIEQVKKHYQKIVKGEYEVAEVITAIALDEGSRTKIEENLKRRFSGKELIFIFGVDTEVPGGIRINVGDNKITFSFETNL